MLVSVHRPHNTMLLRSCKRLSSLPLQPVLVPAAARRFRQSGAVHATPGEGPEKAHKEQEQQPSAVPNPLEQLQKAAFGAVEGGGDLQQQQPRSGSDVYLPRPPSLQRFNETLAQVQREMDHVLTQFFGEDTTASLLRPFIMDRGYGLTSPAVELDSAYGSAAVRVDIDENEKEYLVSAEIPGFSKDHVKATLSPDGILTLKGDVKEEKTEGPPSRSRKTSRISQFTRSFRLPNDVNVEGISASVNHGVLTVVVPKIVKQEIPSKEIPIN